MDASTSSLLEKAAEFMWSDGLQQASDAFVQSHAPLFAGASGIDGEQRLEWQKIYTSYQQLYERALEGFCERQHVELEVFVQACQDALDNSEWAQHRGFAECVLSMATYEYFIKMMTTAAEEAADDRAVLVDVVRRGESSSGGGEGLVDADDFM